MAGSGTPASGAGSALTASEAATMAQASAQTASVPNSLLAGGEAAGTLGSAGGGGASGGSMLASAGPWAALAAAAIINESNAYGTDRRADNTGEYIGDLLTGTVGAQDGKYHGDKIGGPLGSIMKEGSRFTEKTMKVLKPWEWF